MERTEELRNFQDSDNRALEAESYGNEGFAEADEHDLKNRKAKKQVESSKRKPEEEYRLKYVPKSAWNDDRSPMVSNDQLEERGVEEGSGIEGCGGMVETSLNKSPYAPQETDDLETMVAGLERNIHLATDSMEDWTKTRNRVRVLASSAHLEVEHRKAYLVEAIEDCSRRLHDGLDRQLSVFEAESVKATKRLEETLTSMKKSFALRSQLNDKDSRAFRDHLFAWLTSWKESKAPSKLLFAAALSTTEAPIDRAVLEGLFGASNVHDADNDAEADLSAAGNKALANNPGQKKHAETEKVRNLPGNQRLWGKLWESSWTPRFQGKNSDSSKKQHTPAALRIPNKIRDCPELVLTFSCRLKKDKRTCGITDLALTDEGQILVLDKHNKVVKMFDSQGVLLKYFGKNDLRKPSRISRIRSQGQIAVTDESSNSVLIFSEDGRFLSQLVALRRPVSHCQLTDTRVAILEFSTKSVVICDLNGQIISTFPTHLDCPSYIACTKSNNIVITDWKSESFKIFDSTGSEKFTYCHRTSAESTRHVEEPYGVCADNDGIVLMADRKKREIVFYSEEGTEVWSYDDATSQIGVPFAVDCSGSGILAIAEYSGTVRLFKYKTNEDNDERTSDA